MRLSKFLPIKWRVNVDSSKQIIYIVSLQLMFWTIFDGLLAYIAPIQITRLGYSASEMGLILSSSNVFGMIFDFVLARYLRNTHYRRLFLLVFGLSFVYPLLLWSAKGTPMFLIAMSVWGLYGDLNNFATFDFVSRRSELDEHSQSFGIISIFRSVGYLLAPVVAGLAVSQTIGFLPYSISISILIVAFIFYLVLVDKSTQDTDKNQSLVLTKFNFFKEYRIIKQILVSLLPVLVFNTLINVFDGAFWTVGPLFGESVGGVYDFGGLLMLAYTLPGLLVGWYVGKVARIFGQKRTAYYSFMLGAVILLPISFVTNQYLIILLIFLSSIGNSMAWPAIRGAYTDYISESHRYSKEIESLNDFTGNLGYIIGPALSGIMADIFGIKNVFFGLGILSVAVVSYLLVVTPRHISVKVNLK